MKTKELKELSNIELQEKLEIEMTRLVKLRINHAVSPLENTNVLKNTRKDIARINTELKFRILNSTDKLK
ncbi:MAG: 50S ribosomal protein L29 [Bacteroidales bacterium]|jgi:large subunit ribosomal protein L29|nr:50S ribosomal protein L29 [Bacteroidales bacterium]